MTPQPSSLARPAEPRCCRGLPVSAPARPRPQVPSRTGQPIAAELPAALLQTLARRPAKQRQHERGAVSKKKDNPDPCAASRVRTCTSSSGLAAFTASSRRLSLSLRRCTSRAARRSSTAGCCAWVLGSAPVSVIVCRLVKLARSPCTVAAPGSCQSEHTVRMGKQDG